MNHHKSNRNRATLFCAALLAMLPLFIGCGGESAPVEEVQTVQVHIYDNRIEMPNPLPTGAAKIEIINAGTHEHSFGITGPAGDITLDEPLKPGEKTELEAMYLDTGTYRVYCPVDESHGESMQIALNVRPDAATNNG